jgi:hypothetical protein
LRDLRTSLQDFSTVGPPPHLRDRIMADASAILAEAGAQPSPAEAKRRLRSRRFLVGLGAVAATLAVLVVLAIGAHSHRQRPASKPPTHQVTHGGAPFTTPGGVSSGPGSGLWGDTYSGPTGDHIGCIPGRRYALAIIVRNRLASNVTITGVGGPEPAPSIIRRVAVQLRLAPQSSKSEGLAGGSDLNSWSRTPLVPVNVPAGRSAVVQSNFLMRDCGHLQPHQVLTANRAIVLAYQVGGRTGHQTVADPGARIILTRGPTIRTCAAPQGASGLVANDITCGVAATAAVGCHQLASRTSGDCTAAGYAWACTFTNSSRIRERCWLSSKRQNFAIRWN